MFTASLSSSSVTTYQLTGDVTLTDTLTVAAGQNVTIDLNGVIGAGTYKVTAGSYTSIMSFAN